MLNHIEYNKLLPKEKLYLKTLDFLLQKKELFDEYLQLTEPTITIESITYPIEDFAYFHTYLGEFSFKLPKKKPSGGHLNLFNIQEKLHEHTILYEDSSGAKLIQKFNPLNHNYFDKSSLYPADWNDINCWNAMMRALKDKKLKLKDETSELFRFKGFDSITNLKIKGHFDTKNKKLLTHHPYLKDLTK